MQQSTGSGGDYGGLAATAQRATSRDRTLGRTLEAVIVVGTGINGRCQGGTLMPIAWHSLRLLYQ